MLKYKKVLSLMLWLMLIFNSSVNALTLLLNWKYYNVSSEVYNAIKWAKKNKITKASWEYNLNHLNDYSTRATVALMLKRYAKEKLNREYIRKAYQCVFTDISDYPEETQQEIIESCMLGLFKWSNWKFMPTRYMYKSSTLVVLDRLIKKDFNIELQQAIADLKAMWIFKWDVNDIYRPVTRAELFLLIKRVDDIVNVQQTNEDETNNESQSNNLAQNDNSNSSDNWKEDIDASSLLNSLFEDDDETDENTTDENTWNEESENNKNENVVQASTWNNNEVKESTWSNNEVENKDSTVNTENEDENSESSEKSDSEENNKKEEEKKVYDVEISYKDWTYSVLPKWVPNLVLWVLNIKANKLNKIKIDSLKLNLKWFNDKEIINNVYLTNNDWEAITYLKTFNSDKEAELRIKRWYKLNTWDNNLKLVVDLNPSYSDQTIKISWKLNWELGDYTWSLEFETKEYKVIDYNWQKITVDWYAWTPEQKIYVWDENKNIWSFRLTVWSNWENTSSVVIDKMILINQWDDLDDVLQNVVIKNDNWEITAKCDISKIEKDELICDFNDYKMLDWQTNLFNIYADIIWWENSKINFTLDELRDLIAFETKNNVPVIVVKSTTASSFKKYSIQAWKITIAKLAASPIWTTLPVDSNDNTVLLFKVYAPSKFRIDSLKPYLSVKNNSTKDINLKKIFDSIKLFKCNDSEWNDCTPIETAQYKDEKINSWTSKDLQVEFYLNDIEKGDNYYAIKVDLSRYSKDISFKFKVDENSFESPENTNWDSISKDDINWAADWSWFNVGEPTITLSYSNSQILEYVEGKSGLDAWKIQLQNTNVEDVKLVSLRLHFDTNDTVKPDYTQITNVRLISPEWNIIATADCDTNWYVYFDTINYVIDKWTTKELVVKFDTTSNLYTDSNIHKIKFKIDSNSTSDVLFTTSNGLVLNTNWILWTPLVSSDITFYPYGKVYLFRDSNTPESKIIYDTNEYTEVYSFKLKSKYDDIRVVDAYLVASTWNLENKWVATEWTDTVTWTENYVNSISMTIWNVTRTAPLINWIAKFIWFDSTVSANKEETVIVKVKPNNITNIENDNKKLQFKLVLKVKDSNWNVIWNTKFVSLSNWDVVSWTNYIYTGDEIASKLMIIRWWDISYEYWGDSNNTSTEVTNWTNYDIYTIKVNNHSSVHTAKVKQFAIKTTINTSTWTTTLKDFELDISTDWWETWSNWSNLKDDVEFALGNSITWTDWTWTDNFEVSTTWNLTTYLHIRFTWDYLNWYEVNTNSSILFRVKATINGMDENSDSIQFKMEENTKTTSLNWEMKPYSNYATWEPANNAIIWTDNIDSDWVTDVSDTNWFEDYTLWDINVYRTFTYQD